MAPNSPLHRSSLGRIRVPHLLATGGALLLLFLAGRMAVKREPTLRAEAPPRPANPAPSAVAAPAEPQRPSKPAATESQRLIVETSITHDVLSGSSGEPDASSLALAIAWEDATPVADALVAITVGEELIQFGRTSTAGLVELLPVTENTARVFVLEGGTQVCGTALPKPSGAVRIEVPLRSAVRGVVRVEGQPPVGSIEVGLTSSDEARLANLPPTFLVEALGWRIGRPGSPRTRTDEEGRFTIGGLPPDWSGALWPESPYQLLSGNSTLPLSAPVEDLVIDLASPPAIRGRVLSSTGDPVTDCEIQIELTCEDFIQFSNAETEVDGRFFHPLSEENPKSAVLEFSAPGVGLLKTETYVDPVTGTDLGDVTLESAHRAIFRILDAQGTPLEGAIATFGVWRSNPSDAEGLCSLDSLPLRSVEVDFDALSYYPTKVTTPAGPPASENGGDVPIEVRLHRMTSLEILFRDAAESPVSRVRLSVEGTPLFDPESGMPGGRQAILGATNIFTWHRGHRSQGPYVSRVDVDADDEGHVLLTGLQPDTPIHLSAKGRARRDLGWDRTIRLSPGEPRRITASLGAPTYTLRGLVLGEDGEPLSGASVSVPTTGSRPFSAGPHGRFEIGPLTEAHIDLLVNAPGYAPSLLPEVSTGEFQEIHLERGRNHSLLVLDSLGHAHRPDGVVALDGDVLLATATEQPDGSFRFDALPLGPITLQATIWSTPFSTQAWSGPETILEIPPPGSLIVRWRLPEDAAIPASVVLSRPSDRHFVQAQSVSPDDLPAGPIRFPFVLPGTFEVGLFRRIENGLAQMLPYETIEMLPGEAAEVLLEERR